VKHRGIIFGLTILCLSLLAVVLWQAGRQQSQLTELPASESVPTREDASPSSSSSSARKLLEATSPSRNESQALTNRPTFNWRQVESADYRTYVQNLRAIGCPEQTVQDIVAADLRQAFAAKRTAAMADRYRDFKFWKSDAEEIGARSALETKRRAVDDEMNEAAHTLLGAEVTLPTATADWQQAALAQQLHFLPEDKLEPTQAVLLRYAETDAQIRELAWGHGTPENPDERLRLLAAYEQKKTELAALLSPTEYERVELTVSWTADNLRRAMAKFEPTEDEFRLIFREWRAQDENLARVFGTGQPDPGNAQVFANIQAVLSPERYAQYRATWWK
jgi:hypothetical protein